MSCLSFFCIFLAVKSIYLQLMNFRRTSRSTTISMNSYCLQQRTEMVFTILINWMKKLRTQQKHNSNKNGTLLALSVFILSQHVLQFYIFLCFAVNFARNRCQVTMKIFESAIQNPSKRGTLFINNDYFFSQIIILYVLLFAVFTANPTEPIL